MNIPTTADTIGDRLKLVRFSIHPKPSQTKFAEDCGTTKHAYSEYEYNRVVPTDTFLQLVCKKFDVNYAWLKTGQGEMRDADDRSIVEDVVARYNLDANQRRIMEVFLFMDPEKREAVSNAFFEFISGFHDDLQADDIRAEQTVVKRAFELEKKIQKKRREESNPSLDVDSLAHNIG